VRAFGRLGRAIGRIAFLAVALGLSVNAAAAGQVWTPGSGRIVSSVRSRKPAYESGCLGAWRGTLPRERTVKLVDRIESPALAAPAEGVWAGQYDPMTGDIKVIRTAGDITLAHEYGHALLHDLLEQGSGGSRRALYEFSALVAANHDTDPSDVPERLRSVFDEYRGTQDDLYGNSHYAGSFAEYFAESFARIATGDGANVPPRMTAFLASLDSR
jgi:hypothetical protein